MAWPKNEKAGEMYELYKAGASLAGVGRAYGLSRQAVYSLFYLRGWKRRPKRTPLPFLSFNGNKYTLRNTGYYGRTDGKRTLMHRDVWEFHNEPIQKGWDVHHTDCDKENNAIGNLECLPKSEHTRKYSPHNNQYTIGRTLDESRA